MRPGFGTGMPWRGSQQLWTVAMGFRSPAMGLGNFFVIYGGHYFFFSLRMAILAAARRATGMRKGLQLT